MDDGQRQSIGAVIRTMREAMGLTRQELAAASSPEPDERVSVEMIAKVEQGKKAPSAKTLRKLAAGLGVEPLALSSSAARWEAAAASGAGLGALRAALAAGNFGYRAARTFAPLTPFSAAAGLAVAPIAAVAGGFALHEVRREKAELKRLFEARAAELLELGSAEDIAHALATLPQVRSEDATEM